MMRPRPDEVQVPFFVLGASVVPQQNVGRWEDLFVLKETKHTLAGCLWRGARDLY